MTSPDLHGVARTLLVPLACRALESARADAILHDPRAEEVFNALGGSREFLMGVGRHDLLASAMRARQFDRFARGFLEKNPGALVIDIGCGLDTRFDRLDDGRLTWVGIDLPEVIELRRRWLPDTSRSKTIARSMLDLAWLDEIGWDHQPAIFLAEGVFPYFSSREVKPMVLELTRRFPGSELVFDAISPMMVWIHNHSSTVLKQSGARLGWDIGNPLALEAWGLKLLDRWGYFQEPEPRWHGAGFIRWIPPLANATTILRYRLGSA